MARTRRVLGGKDSTSKPKPKSGEAPIDYKDEGEYNEPPTEFLDYCVLIFGEKGVGKTTLASTIPGSYVNQYEVGRRNLRIRQSNVATLTAKKMAAEQTKAKRAGKTYHTPWEVMQAYHTKQMEDPTVRCIIEDTIDAAWFNCMHHICFHKGISDPGEPNDYGQTWRELKSAFLEEYQRIIASEKGLWFLSHANFKEVELRGDDTYEVLVPTVQKGGFEIVKQVCDFAFYYGYNDQKRCVTVRDTGDIWAACGTNEHFCDTQGSPLQRIFMGDNPDTSYEVLQRAFNNEVEAPTKKPTKKRRTK